MTLNNLHFEGKEQLALECESANKENVTRFMEIFLKFRMLVPSEQVNEYDEMEELFNDISIIISTAYNAGVKKTSDL